MRVSVVGATACISLICRIACALYYQIVAVVVSRSSFGDDFHWRPSQAVVERGPHAMDIQDQSDGPSSPCNIIVFEGQINWPLVDARDVDTT